MIKAPSILATLRILVVEDETMILMLIEEILGEFGCTVEVATSIEEALQILADHSPDGVLLDMNIHGRAPIAVAEELGRRSVPFLLVTGFGAGENDPPVIRAAPRLQKPFSSAQLGRRMAEHFVPHTGDA